MRSSSGQHANGALMRMMSERKPCKRAIGTNRHLVIVEEEQCRKPTGVRVLASCKSKEQMFPQRTQAHGRTRIKVPRLTWIILWRFGEPVLKEKKHGLAAAIMQGMSGGA